MDMDAERFAAHILRVDACRVGEPVVGVDDVELFGACHDTCNDRIVVDFLVQVAGIASGKLHTSQVVDVHVVEVGIDVVTEPEIGVGVHDVAYTVFHIVVVDVAPGNRHGVHGNDIGSIAALVAERMWQAQRDVDVALSLQALGDTEVGCCQSAKHMRRILPSKH